MSWICVLDKAELLDFVTPVILNTEKIVAFEICGDEVDPMLNRSDPVTLIKCEGGVVIRVPGTVDAVAALVVQQPNGEKTLRAAIAYYLTAIHQLKSKRKETEEV